MCRVILNCIQKIQGLCSTPEIMLKSSYEHIVAAVLSAAVGKMWNWTRQVSSYLRGNLFIRVIRLNLRVFLF